MKTLLLLLVLLLALPGFACRKGMYNQPRMKPYRANETFADGASARPLPPNSVPRESAESRDVLSTGIEKDGTLAVRPPIQIGRALLERGRERFEVFCSACHGAAGHANGMIVQRGFPPPPSLHEPRLRESPIGHFVDVIRNGYGVMYSYAGRVEPRDRWAIAGYLRVLQLSQNAALQDLTEEERRRLEAQP